MATAKINFEIDSDILASAKAFSAKHNIHLNKIVSTYFASLAQEGASTVPIDRRKSILFEVSMGKLSVADAARELDLGDAGHVLALMRELKIPITLGSSSPALVKKQADMTLEAMRSCMLPIKPEQGARKSRTKASKAVE